MFSISCWSFSIPSLLSGKKARSTPWTVTLAHGLLGMMLRMLQSGRRLRADSMVLSCLRIRSAVQSSRDRSSTLWRSVSRTATTVSEWSVGATSLRQLFIVSLIVLCWTMLSGVLVFLVMKKRRCCIVAGLVVFGCESPVLADVLTTAIYTRPNEDEVIARVDSGVETRSASLIDRLRASCQTWPTAKML